MQLYCHNKDLLFRSINFQFNVMNGIRSCPINRCNERQRSTDTWNKTSLWSSGGNKTQKVNIVSTSWTRKSFTREPTARPLRLHPMMHGTLSYDALGMGLSPLDRITHTTANFLQSSDACGNIPDMTLLYNAQIGCIDLTEHRAPLFSWKEYMVGDITCFFSVLLFLHTIHNCHTNGRPPGTWVSCTLLCRHHANVSLLNFWHIILFMEPLISLFQSQGGWLCSDAM